MNQGPDRYYRSRLQGRQCYLHPGDPADHRFCIAVGFFADHPGSGHRAGDLYQYGDPVLYGDGAAVYRFDLYRYDTAGVYCRLCDTDDYQVQAREISWQRQADFGADRTFDVDAIYHGQCTGILRSDFRCCDLFRH